MECKPAASSTTPVSSCERIISDFVNQGHPLSPTVVSEGTVLGGFEILTPKVGDGFSEWAISGYDLQGRTKQVPAGVNYDKHGDWMFDKTAIQTETSESGVYDKNYLKKEK